MEGGPSKNGQIGFLVPKDAQRSETFAKRVFRFFKFFRLMKFSFQGFWDSREIFDKKYFAPILVNIVLHKFQKIRRKTILENPRKMHAIGNTLIFE